VVYNGLCWFIVVPAGPHGVPMGPPHGGLQWFIEVYDLDAWLLRKRGLAKEQRGVP